MLASVPCGAHVTIVNVAAQNQKYLCLYSRAFSLWPLINAPSRHAWYPANNKPLPKPNSNQNYRLHGLAARPKSSWPATPISHSTAPTQPRQRVVGWGTWLPTISHAIAPPEAAETLSPSNHRVWQQHQEEQLTITPIAPKSLILHRMGVTLNPDISCLGVLPNSV